MPYAPYAVSELTYDYALPYDPNAKGPCNCGAKKCRGSLHLPKPMAPPMEEEVEVTDALFKPDCPSFVKTQRLPKPTKDEARLQLALWGWQSATGHRKANH